MLNNYPDMKRSTGPKKFGTFGTGYVRKITPEKEERMQREWFEKKFTKRGRTHGLRHFFPKNCRDNPVVCVRGNHEFTDLGPMFGGDVFEIHGPEESRTIHDLKFGGFRGVPVLAYEWSDEKEQCDFDELVDTLPLDLDVVVTHAPPWGILDLAYGTERIGIQPLASWIQKVAYNEKHPKLFCFGHAHYPHQIVELGNMVFSNAATTKRVIEVEA